MNDAHPPDRSLFPTEAAVALAQKFEHANRRARFLSVLVLIAIEVLVVAMLIHAYPHAFQFGPDPAPVTQPRDASGAAGSGH